jgi:protein-disulfide isomerase-like protein with CxxC motif
MRGTPWTRAVGVGLAVWVAALTPLAAALVLRVTPITRDGRVLVSFEMRDAFTHQVRAAIGSGLTTTFVYEAELRRAAPLWIDRTFATATVSASVRFDTLTRFYQVARMQDGRVAESQRTEDLQVVERLLTAFDGLALFSTAALEPNAEYYVRVRARTRPRNSSFLWPWGDRAAASGIAKFTFIP